MAGSGFKITPSDLHKSGGTLESFSGKVGQGGDKMQSAGSDLVSHAGQDKSGIGKVITDTVSKSTEAVGKVFTEGSRVVGAAGQRLHSNADSHSANEAEQTKNFKNLHDTPPDSSSQPKSGSGSGPAKHDPPGGSTDKPPTSKTTPDDSGDDDPKKTSTPGDGRVCKSDPVDVASGEVIMSQRDVALAGLLPLILDRTHVSSYRDGHWFGPSWASTVDQRLAFEDTRVRYFAPDGMILHYPVPAAGEPVLPVEGPRWPLTMTADGTFTVRDTTAGQTLHFDDTKLLAVTGPDGHRIDVEFDETGNPLVLRHSGGYRVGLTVARQRIRQVRLLGEGTVADVPIMRYGYDEQGRLTSVVDSSGLPTLYSYDDAGRLAGWQDRNGVWYRYEYDEQGRCVRTVGADGFLSSAFAYDTDNRTTRYTDSLGNVTTYELNEARQLVRETDPLGNSTTFTWDRYDRKLSETDPLGHVTLFQHDEDGRLTRVEYADGTSTSADREASGEVGTITTPDGVAWLSGDEQGTGTVLLAGPDGVTTQRRDGLVRDPAGLIVATSAEPGASTHVTYDRFGFPAIVTDPLGGITRFGWTVEGLPLWQVDPDGSRHAWRYDAEGNEIEYVDPAGRATRTEYGGFDLPVAVTDPAGARTEYRYDTELRLTELRTQQGMVWRYEYDAASRLARAVDFDGRARDYRYDAAGQLVAVTDPTGAVTAYDYDPVGNLAARHTGGVTTTFGYDALDRLVHAANPDVELVLERDAFGRVVAETVAGRTVRVTYDPAGRPVRRETPSGAVSEWTYDAAGQPVTLHSGGEVVTFGHDRVGRETGRGSVEGFHLTQTYSGTDGLTDQTVASSKSLQRKGFRYLPGGDLAGTNSTAAGPREFEWDPAGRVVGVRSPDGQERYRYDALGTIVHAQWPATVASGRAAGERRYRGTVLEQAGAVRYRHDALGRRTASEFAGGVRDYVWNADDRLVEVSNPDGSRWRYRYDPLGRRVDKSRLAGDSSVVERTEFSWFGELLVEQVHTGVDGDRHVTTWDYHPADDTVLTQVERLLPAGSDDATGVRWYTVLTDQVGSPTAMFTPTGELAWQRRPTLWGLADRSAGVDIPLRFPGQYHDAETGLHYNHQRYYDPETATFVSPDPYGLTAAATPMSYVSNPLHWIDPLGLMPCSPNGTGASQGSGKGKAKPGPGKSNGGIQKRPKKVSSGPSRASSRVKPSRLEDQTTWAQDFGISTKFGGGTYAHQQFGPNTVAPGKYGSTPGAHENTAVNHLNAQNTASGYTGRPEWIKGHLINDNLGGKGESQNLTPMTQDGNAGYLHNVETPMKNSLTVANQAAQNTSNKDYWYGVDFTATVHHAGPIDPQNPHSAVGQHVDVTSHYIRKPKFGNGPAEPVPPGELPNRLGGEPWPPLPNGRLDPRTGEWTPHSGQPDPVAGPSGSAHDDTMSTTSTLTPVPSEFGDDAMDMG